MGSREGSRENTDDAASGAAAAPHEKLPRVDQSCRLAIGRFPDDVGDRWHVPVLI